jgi:hypothetical protein
MRSEHARNIAFARSGGKTFAFVAPDGTTYEDVVNVTAFAREHGVYPSALCRLGSLKQKKHKGWRLAV